MREFSRFDERMFQRARQVAKTSTYKTHSLGCVLVYKHHVISAAANSNKTHPKQKEYNKKYRVFSRSAKPIMDTGHAEMLALFNIPYPIGQQIDWSKVRVYVYRISKGKKRGFGMARPCNACLNALKDAGIQHLYYTTDAGYAYERIV